MNNYQRNILSGVSLLISSKHIIYAATYIYYQNQNDQRNFGLSLRQKTTEGQCRTDSPSQPVDYALKAYIIWFIYTPGKGSLSALHGYLYAFSKWFHIRLSVNRVGSSLYAEYNIKYYTFISSCYIAVQSTTQRPSTNCSHCLFS